MELQKNYCRHCGRELTTVMVNLGVSPLSNSYIKPENYGRKEGYYPLCVYVCDNCKLAQISEFESPDAIFSDYSYFSSYSTSWLAHAKKYCEDMTERFHIGKDSFVVEIASNDGYLLKNFVAAGVPSLGIEPAQNVAKVAQNIGVPTISEFFGERVGKETAEKYRKADLMAANNVLAHVPDINDFVKGFKALLAPEGVVTFEFPHLLNLMKLNEFDTIYHEHFSYLSLLAVRTILKAAGLRVFDVQELPTHGGSLRVFACHENAGYSEQPGVDKVLNDELCYGLNEMETYEKFAVKVQQLKRNILSFLIAEKNAGRTIVGYGAPAKGNTMLNYCGISTDFIDYTVDMSPYKQNVFLPGSRIPVYAPEKLAETKPDDIIILPWNLKNEIKEELAYTKEWGARLITLVPDVEILK